jgi:hypothetical protein
MITPELGVLGDVILIFVIAKPGRGAFWRGGVRSTSMDFPATHVVTRNCKSRKAASRCNAPGLPASTSVNLGEGQRFAKYV